MPGVTFDREDQTRRCTCVCVCVKKERTFALVILGCFQLIIALGSLALGNWAFFAYSDHLQKAAAYPFWSGGIVLVSGFLCVRTWKHVNKSWITTTATATFITALMYMSCGCWMINMLVAETTKHPVIKAYIFYGFNISSSVVGFLLAGISSGIAWSIRETLPSRRSLSARGQSTNQVAPSGMVTFSVEEFERSITDLGPPPPYQP